MRTIRAALLLVLTVALAAAGMAGGWMAWRTLDRVQSDLSRSSALVTLESGPQATLIYDRHDALSYSLFSEQRIDVPLDRVSAHMIDAVLAAEDHRFFDHFGLDPVRMAGAAVANFKAGGIVEGGSTITQQLARNIELGKQRTWSRKIQEVLLAAELEARYSKRDILQTYLNTAYFGDGYYGVEAAARGYFGKTAATLDVAESAMLAGLIRAPSANSPSKSVENATTVRNTVLRGMRELNLIDEAELRTHLSAEMSVRPRRASGLAAHAHTTKEACGLYYFEEVRRQLTSLFSEDDVLQGGLRVFTTYDPSVQRAAEQSVTERLAQLGGERSGLQGALVALDPKSGYVRALVGGRDFHESSFNRATQAHRQPGSAFKPFVWAAAVERGWAPGTVLTSLDAQIGDGTWMPSGEHEAESYTLRRALTVSSNRAAAQLMQQVGLSSTLYTARKLGIESELPAVPSLSLGTGEVTLLEMVSAYGAFANEGTWTRPTLITRVEDREGNVLWSAPHDQHRAISTGAAYLMNSMMSDVIDRGTGYRARQMGFSLPAAGKTGTSDDYADAWFIGYTPNLVAGVWMGFDARKTIARGAYASDVAVPAWGAFMREATKGNPAVWYDRPADVERVEICRASGHRAGEMCRRSPGFARTMLADGTLVDRPVAGGITTELFTLGSAPYGECPVHTGLLYDAAFGALPELESDPRLRSVDAGLTDLGHPSPDARTGLMTLAGTRTEPAGLSGLPVSESDSHTAPSLSLPSLPTTPIRHPAGIKIEKVARPDGTVVTVIRNQ